MDLPFVKTESCDKCDSEKYFECPNCLTYKCECHFSLCVKCNIYHCFQSKCGRIDFTRTPQEIAHITFMEFEVRNYIAPWGKKVFHCRINVGKTKCNMCNFEGWADTSSFEECYICKEINCCTCTNQCETCDNYFCSKHEMKSCDCGGVHCLECETCKD